MVSNKAILIMIIISVLLLATSLLINVSVSQGPEINYTQGPTESDQGAGLSLIVNPPAKLTENG